MKAIILVRVSTFSQDFEAQKLNLIEYAKQLGVEEYHIIADKESAIALSEEERNGLNEMKKFLSEHNDYTTVIVWEISRLARTEKVLHSIKQYFIDNKIQLYIYDKRYKLLNDDGTENSDTSLLFSLYAYFASNEMKVKKARFMRTKKLNATTGKYNGAYIKFGWTLDKNKYVVKDKVFAPIAKKIFEEYATGKYSIKQLCKEIGTWGIEMNVRYLTEMLRNTAYTGYSTWDDKRRSERKYEPIISKELFDKVQAVKIANSSAIDKSKRYFLAAKLIRCPVCKGSYIYKSKTYTCINASMKLKACDNHLSINQYWLDKILLHIALFEHKIFSSTDKKERILMIEEENKDIQSKVDYYDKRLGYIAGKVERANKLFIDGRVNEVGYNQLTDDIFKEEKELNKEKEEYIRQIENNIHLIDTLSSSNSRENMFGELTQSDLYAITHKYIKNVELARDVYENRKCTRIKVHFIAFTTELKFEDRTREFLFFPQNKIVNHKVMENGEYVVESIHNMLGSLMKVMQKCYQ